MSKGWSCRNALHSMVMVKKNKIKKITGQGRAFLKYWFNWQMSPGSKMNQIAKKGFDDISSLWTKWFNKPSTFPHTSRCRRRFNFFFLWHGHFTSFLPQVLNIDKCMDVSLLNRKKNSKNKNIKPTVIQGRSYKNNYHFLHIYFKLWYLKYNYVYAYCTTGIIELYCIV